MQTADYDARGRLVRHSARAYAGDRVPLTEYHDHDALGRPGRRVEDRAGHAHETVTTTYRYEGPTTHVTRPGGLRESRTVDAWGQLVETVDAAGTATHYRHDGQGNLILIDSGAGHRLTAHHDARGRRRRLTDPDSGTWRFAYNGLGELLWQTDARGQAVDFHYDPLGRLVARDVNGVPEAEWHYDRSRPGVLDAVHGSEGFARTFTYDERLRPVQVTTQVAEQRRFTQQYAYDGYYGRLKAMRAPDGEALAFDHDAHGYPVATRAPTAPGAWSTAASRPSPRAARSPASASATASTGRRMRVSWAARPRKCGTRARPSAPPMRSTKPRSRRRSPCANAAACATTPPSRWAAVTAHDGFEIGSWPIDSPASPGRTKNQEEQA